MEKEIFDKERGYCRMLGHELTFSYCRLAAGDRPCFKVLDCWFQRFDVDAYIRHHFSETEIADFLKPPKPKVLTLIDLIEQARSRS